MEQRQVGDSDLFVGVFGLGCWQFGVGSYWGAREQKDVNQVVDLALEHGINYFDTAEMYNDGDSERALGIALQGKRSQAVIGTKLSPSHTEPSVLRAHCEASLQRLKTDYIDLYMLHWPVNPIAVKHYTGHSADAALLPTVQEVFGALTELQIEGKIRHIGISNHGVRQMEEALASGARIAANQLPYNLLSRAIESSILPFCNEHRIGVIGYMGLLQGVLSGSYATLDDIPPLRTRTRHFHHSRGDGTRHGEAGAEAEVLQVLQHTRELADELGVGMSKLCLAWAFSHPGIATTICGARTVQQLAANLEAAEYTLSRDIIDRLNQISHPVLHTLGASADYWESVEHSRIW